jgi:hypothetical protein
MLPSSTPSASIFKIGSMVGRLTMSAMLILALAASSWGQTATPKPGPDKKRAHWHKYIAKELGFSFWYPDTYRPTDAEGTCKDNGYRRYLLCLEQQDDSHASILVTLVIAVPFFIKTNAGGNAHTREKIGQHVFYCGLGGSMGTGFSDECIFNLNGKTLEFNFSPAENTNSGEKTHPLVFRSLKTFRTL